MLTKRAQSPTPHSYSTGILSITARLCLFFFSFSFLICYFLFNFTSLCWVRVYVPTATATPSWFMFLYIILPVPTIYHHTDTLQFTHHYTLHTTVFQVFQITLISLSSHYIYFIIQFSTRYSTQTCPHAHMPTPQRLFVDQILLQ